MQVLTFVSAFTRVKPRAHIGTFADIGIFANSGLFAYTRRIARTAAFAWRKGSRSRWQVVADSLMRPQANRTRSLHPVDNAGHDDPGEF